MERRDFLKKTLQAGFAASTLPFINYKELFGKNLFPVPYDLVAVKGGEPDIMFDKAIESLGGMKSFIKKGQTVVVKPNIGWDVLPERAGNTNPKLVTRIIQHCYSAGAKKVYVFDHTCDEWRRCYTNSGIEKAAKDAGAQVVSGDSERYYQDVNIKGADVLTSAKVHELILESNVFINVPILKHHSSSKLTVSMKNLMGIVWDRGYWHRNDLHQCIAEFGLYRKPDLNIVDAYCILKKNGPKGVSKDDVVMLKSLIVSKDIVAADAASAKLFGIEPDSISHIKIAHGLKVGTKDLDKLSINRIKM